MTSEIKIENVDPHRGGGRLMHLRSRVSSASTEPEEAGTPVLDWRFVAVSA